MSRPTQGHVPRHTFRAYQATSFALMLIHNTSHPFEENDKPESMSLLSFEDRLHLWHRGREGHCTCVSCRPRERCRSHQIKNRTVAPGDGHNCTACNTPFCTIVFDANLKPPAVESNASPAPHIDRWYNVDFGSAEIQRVGELENPNSPTLTATTSMLLHDTHWKDSESAVSLV
jgi:hypothetical protein